MNTHVINTTKYTYLSGHQKQLHLDYTYTDHLSITTQHPKYLKAQYKLSVLLSALSEIPTIKNSSEIQ
jgi:hypothetical protein